MTAYVTSTTLADSIFPVVDTVGAWVPHGKFVVPPHKPGSLSGLGFAAKDLYDVAGQTTGAGNPAWLATHAVATRTSVLVERLLDSGATLLGKTLTDELAYSIQGDNVHYGTPINSRAPDRVPGGSSSGSAAAVAAGLCDFALGTDTGGSTRVPASYCGLWGLRTTHGLLSAAGLVPLAPKFDTPTWLAASAGTFESVAAVLLPPSDVVFQRAVVLDDACAQAEPVFHAPLERVVAALEQALLSGPASHVQAAAGSDLDAWRMTYVTASAYDAWQVHGAWINEARPVFGDAVAGRWKMAAAVTAEAASTAFARQAQIAVQMSALLGNDGVAVLPSASSVALARDAASGDIDTVRNNTFRITCIAGLAGLPQVSLPFLTPDGLPIGVSLMGPAGSDAVLVRLAVLIGTALGCVGTGDADAVGWSVAK